MSARKTLPRIVIVVMLGATPALADAPRDQYEKFDADDATIVDSHTGLEWDRRGVFHETAFVVASSGCAIASALGPQARLPTVKELLTIVDEEPHSEFERGAFWTRMIDEQAFRGTPTDFTYWTSTPAPEPDTFWTVDFSTGVTKALSKNASANARCVK